MQSSPRRGSRWLPWLGGIAAIATMLILSLVLRFQASESRAWPITKSVVARLATDDGARDLFAKNPRLAESYPDAEAFVAAVRAQRAAFGALAAPGRGDHGETFRADSDPDGLRVIAKGTGGAWMQMDVEQSDGSEAGHAAIGEGITLLGFADSEASLDKVREASHQVYNEARWTRFKAVEQALLTEDGTQALLKANPGFLKDGAAREAFLRQARDWRPRLAARPIPATWKEGVDAKDETVSMNHRSMPPFRDQVVVGWELKDGAWLKVEWSEGRLTKITLEN